MARDDSAELTEMVRLLGQGAPGGVKGVAKEVVTRAGLSPINRHVERLRKKYRKLAADGLLPQPDDLPPGLMREATAWFQRESEKRAAAQEALAAAESRAVALGVDLEVGNFHPEIQTLEETIHTLQGVVEGSAGHILGKLLSAKPATPEEVADLFRTNRDELKAARELYEVLSSLQINRRAVRSFLPNE